MTGGIDRSPTAANHVSPDTSIKLEWFGAIAAN
jgi:hypothetical protein